MKNQIHFPILISYFSIALASIFFVTKINSEEQKNNSLLIDNSSNTNKILEDSLMPMPLGDFNSALKRVEILSKILKSLNYQTLMIFILL